MPQQKAGAGRSHQPRLDRPQCLLPCDTGSFLGACVDGEDEEIGEGAEDEVMMQPCPGAAFKVIETEVVLGALEVLLDVPAAPG